MKERKLFSAAKPTFDGYDFFFFFLMMCPVTESLRPKRIGLLAFNTLTYQEPESTKYTYEVLELNQDPKWRTSSPLLVLGD